MRSATWETKTPLASMNTHSSGLNKLTVNSYLDNQKSDDLLP